MIFLHPFSSGLGMDRIVIQLNSRANFQVRIGSTKPINFVEINALMITVVISERDIAETEPARMINPGLQELRRVWL